MVDEILNGVKSVLVQTLGLSSQEDNLNAEFALLGVLSELDSMSVVAVIAGLEDYFAISVDDDDVVAEVFSTVGTLVNFVSEKLSC